MKILTKIVSSDFLDTNERNLLINQLKLKCETMHIILSETSSDNFDALLILTGGTERDTVKYIEENSLKRVILLTHNGNNSLAAALEITACLKKIGIFVDIQPIEVSNLKNVLSKLIEKTLPLNNYRIGLIGKPSDWLVASSHSKEIVKNSWGAELIDIPLKEISQLITRLYPEYSSIKSNNIIEPSKKDMINSEAVYIALKKIICDYHLDGITIRCFDLLKKLKMTACYALAKLNAENIPAACEGDIPSIIGMLWAKKISNHIPWMANPSQIDLENSKLVLAHCTAPMNYLKNVVFRSHFESGIAVGIQGDLDFDNVTLFRFGGNFLNEFWCSEAILTKHLTENNLCRTQIEIKLPDYKLQELLSNPLGNHLLVLPGSFNCKHIRNP